MSEETQLSFDDIPVFPGEYPPSPDYLVSLFVALQQLKELRNPRNGSELTADIGRYCSIAITDLEKLIAFVSLYLS
jgi:hypothetical protein